MRTNLALVIRMGEGLVDSLYPARRGGHGAQKKEVASPVDGGPGQSTAEGTWVARATWTVIDVIAIGALSLAAPGIWCVLFLLQRFDPTSHKHFC